MRFLRTNFLEISIFLALYIFIASIVILMILSVNGATNLVILFLALILAAAFFFLALVFGYRADLKLLMMTAQLPEANPFLVMHVNSSGEILYANPIGKAFLAQFSPNDGALPHVVDTELQRSLNLGQRVSSNLSIEQYIYDFEFVPSADLSYANIFGVEITEPTHIRTQLAEREKMLRKILDETPIVLYALDKDGIFTMSEGQALGPLNVKPGEVVGKSILDTYALTDDIGSSIQKVMNGETISTVAHIGTRVFESNLSPLIEEDGVISGVIGVSMDVTDHYNAHEQLRKNLEMYHQLFEQTNDGVVIAGLDQHIIRANKRAAEMLGKNAADLVGMDASPFIFPGGATKTLRTNQVFEHEYTRSDGSTLWAEIGITIIRNSAGIPTFVQCVIRDVSDRKHAEERLRESEEILRLFVEHTPTAVAMLDTSMCYIITSARWKQDYNLGNQSVIGRNHYEVLPDTPDHWKEIHQRCLQGAVERSEADLFINENGQRSWIRWEVRPWHRGNKISGVIMFTEVITDIKEAQLAIQATTTRLETLLANMQSGILVEDENRHIAIANQTFCDLFGLDIPARALIGNDCKAALEASKGLYAEPDLFIAEVNTLLARKEISIGVEVELADGRVFERDYIPIVLDDNYLGHLWQYRDVTARKQSEAERERLIAILNNSQDFIGLANLEGEFMYVNPAGLEMTGYTADQVEQLRIDGLVDADAIKRIRQQDIPFAIDQGMWRGENQFRRLDGSTFPVEQAIFVIRDEEQQPKTIATIVTDITERKQAEQELMLQDRAIASSTSGIIITDARQSDMPLTYVNPAFLKTIGYELNEVIGRNCRFLQGDDRDQPGLDELRTALREGRDSTVILRNYRKNGELFYNELSIAPVRDFRGNITHFVGISNDISDRITTEKSLALARDQALEASRLKSEFLATMSHEIRTPMNGIIGMNELLLTTQLSAEQREFASTAYREAHHLLRIINDILDFSKIEADKVVLEKLDFLPSELMDSVLNLLRPAAAEKGLKLTLNMAGSVPAVMVGDVQRLRQILVNLLSNAIKFTHAGEILVEISTEPVMDQDNLIQLNVAVHDTGIGLSDSARKRLFKPFTQADGSTTRKYGGTGLGLAISQSLVQLMDGEIGVESQEGQGSNFYFHVILDVPSEAEINPEDRPVRVLIVDDSAAHRQLIERYLRSWGIVYQSIGSSEAALALLRESENLARYDVIIVDRILPEMDGLELADVIRNQMSPPLPHLVMLTAFDEPGLGVLTAKHGFQGYLIKPVNPSQLLETIVRLTDDSLEVSGITDNSMIESADSPLNDNSSTHILLVEDNLVNRDVTSRQLMKLGYSVRSVTNGKEAVQIVQEMPELFDLVLMDCQMPEMDGLEATRRIRKWEETTDRHIPIVAITANAERSDIDLCYEVGMDDYITKPVTIKRLEKLVQTWVSQKQRPG